MVIDLLKCCIPLHDLLDLFACKLIHIFYTNEPCIQYLQLIKIVYVITDCLNVWQTHRRLPYSIKTIKKMEFKEQMSDE